MEFNPVIIWFLTGLVLAFLEFAVPGIILVFFGAGAWITAITTFLGLTPSTPAQIAVFVVSSVILLLALRGWIHGQFSGHITGVQDPNTNLDEFIGHPVVVLERVEPGGITGAVEFKGTRWKAVSKELINPGESAVILAMDGITLTIGTERRS